MRWQAVRLRAGAPTPRRAGLPYQGTRAGCRLAANAIVRATECIVDVADDCRLVTSVVPIPARVGWAMAGPPTVVPLLLGGGARDRAHGLALMSGGASLTPRVRPRPRPSCVRLRGPRTELDRTSFVPGAARH
jgi:hypothetical protein